jgi:hypothetical protein
LKTHTHTHRGRERDLGEEEAHHLGDVGFKLALVPRQPPLHARDLFGSTMRAQAPLV